MRLRQRGQDAKIASLVDIELCSLKPSWLIKRSRGILTPVIARMRNASLQQSAPLMERKHAIVRPLLKKSSLDPNDPSSY
jgi:hypothetical protein